MKKIMIISLIALMALSIVGCSNKSVDPSISNEDPRYSEQGALERKAQESDYTNNNNNNNNNNNETLKEDIGSLYKDLENEITTQKERFDTSSWNNFTEKFNEQKTKIKNSVNDGYLGEAMTNLENLYAEYDTAIKNGVEVSKDKVIEMKNKIEELLNR